MEPMLKPIKWYNVLDSLWFFNNLAVKMNNMMLIADSGSTKTDWCLTDTAGNKRQYFHTQGYNPYFMDSEAIESSLGESPLSGADMGLVSQIFFYGAGCSTHEKRQVVIHALSKFFPGVINIQVNHDLLASARALLGREAGFAAILGTGTNTCLYNGTSITLHIDSLGYLLGDEGSGSYIGKKFVRDFMRNQLDEELRSAFIDRFQITGNDQIYHSLFHTQFPNRYLAGFCKFSEAFPDHPYIQTQIRDGFQDFFSNLVTKYPEYKNHTFNCCGSVGFTFRKILAEVVEKNGMLVGKIIQSPLEDLVEFHLFP